MMRTLIHELGHFAYELTVRMTPARFEIEHDASGEFFGDATPQEGQADRSLIVTLAYVGPLAEVRYAAGGGRIDAARSAPLLLNLLASSGDVQVYFEGESDARPFPKAIFGTDWNVAGKTAAAAKANIPDLDVSEALLSCMHDAIAFVNDDGRWQGLVKVAQTLESLPQLKGLKKGERVDVVETAIALVKSHVPLGEAETGD